MENLTGKKLPTPEELRKLLPLSYENGKLVKSGREEIEKILSGQSPKKIVLVGPCSAHDPKAVLEYAIKIGKAFEKLPKFLPVIRIYTHKPRSRGVGYKGLAVQPDPKKDADLEKGLFESRSLHLSVLENTGLLTADELLYPETCEYLSDVVGYFAIGTRSVENELHRQVVSGLDFPCGLKNPLNGNLESLAYFIKASQSSHVFAYRNKEVHTQGNLFAHAVLRGFTNEDGLDFPNYDGKHLDKLENFLKREKVQNPSVIVDCNHSDSGKKYLEQKRIALEVADWICERKSPFVKGWMIESFLLGGTGDGSLYGQSITDPCLSLEDTVSLLETLHEKI